MVDYKRSERVADQIRMEMADILLNKVKDPRIGFVTVVSVEVSDDLRHAKIFVSVLGGDPANSFKGLEKAKAFMRGELGRRLKLRLVPELSFHEDRSAEQTSRIDQLIEEIRGPRS